MTTLLKKKLLLITDGDFLSTAFLADSLKDLFSEVEIKVANQLVGTSVQDKEIIISRLCHPIMDWLPGYLKKKNSHYHFFVDKNFLEDATDPFYQQPAVIETLDVFIKEAKSIILLSLDLLPSFRKRYPKVKISVIDERVPSESVASFYRATKGNDIFLKKVHAVLSDEFGGV